VIFTDREKLKGHKLTVHGAGSKGDGHPQCQFCLKFYGHTNGLRTHQRSVHLDCPVHLRKEHSRKVSSFAVKVGTIKCHVCKESEICSGLEELKEHERTEGHAEEVKKRIGIHCNVCRESFNGNLSAFKAHLESEGHVKEVQSLGEFNAAKFCVPCRVKVGEVGEEGEESQWSKHNLSASHRKRCEFKEKTKDKLRLECPECPKVFELVSRFERHLKENHSKTRPSEDNCQVSI